MQRWVIYCWKQDIERERINNIMKTGCSKLFSYSKSDFKRIIVQSPHAMFRTVLLDIQSTWIRKVHPPPQFWNTIQVNKIQLTTGFYGGENGNFVPF